MNSCPCDSTQLSSRDAASRPRRATPPSKPIGSPFHLLIDIKPSTGHPPLHAPPVLFYLRKPSARHRPAADVSDGQVRESGGKRSPCLSPRHARSLTRPLHLQPLNPTTTATSATPSRAPSPGPSRRRRLLPPRTPRTPLPLPRRRRRRRSSSSRPLAAPSAAASHRTYSARARPTARG